MHPTIYTRLSAAMPDAITAAMFFTAWFVPLVIDGFVRNMALIMIVELLLILASGCYSAYILTGERSTRQLIPVIAGMSVFYLLFIIVWCLIFGEWWPLMAFGWLVVGKLQLLRTGGNKQKNDLITNMVMWSAMVVMYMLAVMLGLLLPLPEFCITGEVVPLLNMNGEGEWLERPHTVIASGAMYFTMLALVKFKAVSFLN